MPKARAEDIPKCLYLRPKTFRDPDGWTSILLPDDAVIAFVEPTYAKIGGALNRGDEWYRKKREEEIVRRGAKCERCGDGSPFEFHHKRPTGLNGRGRGRNRRIADLRAHPMAYIMLCEACHRREHGAAP